MKKENLFFSEIEERERQQRNKIIGAFLVFASFGLSVFGAFYLLTKI